MAVDKNKLDEEACSLRFYKIILSWDYLRLLKESDRKNHKKDKGDDDTTTGLKKAKNSYKDVEDYIATFEPLLFEEVKAQIVQGKKDDEEDTQWMKAVTVGCSEIDGFHFPMISSGDAESISQNDLLLLSNKEICSLSTIAREYVALRSVSSLPFKDLILSAAESNHTTEDHAWKISRPLKDFLESNHNKSQLDAINAGLSRKTFVLIQGPPGTGKTQTILGLLSAILHATPARVHSNRGNLSVVKRGPELSMADKYNHWGKASPWLAGINPLDQEMPIDGDDGFFPTSGNELKPEVVNSSRKYRVRVLVCAPSNSALDEIVLRILNTGIRDENDRAYSPKIVRIGLKAHHSVQAVSMDYLVEQRLSGMDSQTGDRQKQGGPLKDKDSIRGSILDEAVIVFSTLSFSASPVFSKLNRGFDVVIIDEAAQAVEPSTLVPLSNGCKQVFLVGDPVQLPATVISPIAGNFGYCISLFERLQRGGYPVQMLKTQYRMHPEIRNFPSREFYKEALEDGPDVEEQTRRSWHKYRCFGPFCFFDIHEGKESQPSGSGSWQNVDEVEFVLAMYHKLVSRYPELKSSSRLAIISPYRHQVKLLRQKFRETFGVESDKVVDINTVDGFQGREKDVAIFSCVRASKDKGIGFVADFRRMNVGITRARSSVLVVGSASTLRRGDKHWQNLVDSAEQRNALYKVSKPYDEFFSQENLTLMEVEAMHDKPEAPPEDMDVEVPVDGTVVEADPVQPEENDWGDAGEDGGYDED
ncbi:probable helicase MAGATAMA 3 isoform X2 [Nicotiana sylvestris]|uniref:Probable helicase MAGATAMA 3 isoform X3 n=1 Tax=Nicotiana sylvestris TaxID=4096 RepID=A0A1U7X2D5_NICSY|nr:PREDICTED: probable helicase MAGATAMA 3 isoform X3 [Nicotiana sylvestris]